MRPSRTVPLAGLLIAAAGAMGPAEAQTDDATSDSIQDGLDSLTIRLPPPIVFEPLDDGS